jgi:hypothetical protein
VLESKGTDFIVYSYVSVRTGEPVNKYSVLLRKGEEVEHLFIIRLPKGRELVVKHETEESPGKRGIYDPASKKVIYF